MTTETEATALFTTHMHKMANAIASMYDCLRHSAVVSEGERAALEKASEAYQDWCTAREETRHSL